MSVCDVKVRKEKMERTAVDVKRGGEGKGGRGEDKRERKVRGKREKGKGRERAR